MERLSAIVLAAALILLPSCVKGPEDAIARSAALQRSGAPADALTVLLDARVESPESGELLFAIAQAEATLGDYLAGQHDLVEARRHFARASMTYARCEGMPQLAEGAAYNAATCLLRLDDILERQKNAVERVSYLKAAVTALDRVVQRYPAMERARKNLDCARYRLAMLQQTPPENSDDGGSAPEKSESATGVAGATTQLPGATVTVEEGSMVVLKTGSREEAAP